MFYPGDPTEQRKRALIAKLAGRGQGGAGGGSGVARAPGFFGKGIGFSGMPGNSAFGHAQGNQAFAGGGGLAGALSAYGGGDEQVQQTQQQFQPQSPYVDPNPVQHLQSPISGLNAGPQTAYMGGALATGFNTGTQTAQISPIIKQLLAGYGQQQPQMPAGYGRSYY